MCGGGGQGGFCVVCSCSESWMDAGGEELELPPMSGGVPP